MPLHAGAPVAGRPHVAGLDARRTVRTLVRRSSRRRAARAISRTGTLGGANYRIEVPADWKGGLVVFAHGIQRGVGPGDVTSPPLATHILGEGHAWAASGYRDREYRPHLFIEDLIALRELFLREIGHPRWAIIYGQSMGGHIVVATLELHPGLYQGGLAECGLVDGIGIADYLLAYTAAAELISGVRLLDAPDKTAFAQLLNDGVVPALGTPGAYTARGRQFDSVVKYLMGADASGHDLPLRLKGLRSRYLLNMIHRHPDVEQEPMPGGRAASTVQVRYRIDPGLGLSEDDLNKRVRPDPPGEGRAVAERESGVRGAHRAPHGAADDAPRDRRCVGSAEPRAGLPAQDDRGRHGPSARPARGARAQPLRLLRGDARAGLRRPGRVDRARRAAPGGRRPRERSLPHRDEVDARSGRR
jgi:hypothetical protein